MFDRRSADSRALPDLGSAFAGEPTAGKENHVVHGKDLLKRAIDAGPGVLISIRPPEGAIEYVIPLSGTAQGSAVDDAILSVGGLERRVGNVFRTDRRAYPIDSALSHWSTIREIQRRELQHSSTPFFVVGETNSVTRDPNLKQIALTDVGRRDYTDIGLFYPANLESCSEWAAKLVAVVYAIESANGPLTLNPKMSKLLTEIRAHVRDDASNEAIAKSLVQYEKTHGDRPHGDCQVPEFILNEKFK